MKFDDKIFTMKFFCVHCQKETRDMEIDCDPVLFRERISIFCHGAEDIVTRAAINHANRGETIRVFV